MINPKYLNSFLIDPQVRDTFWKVVLDCLIELHGLSAFDATQRSRDLRNRIETAPAGMSAETFYHAEPFDVSCDLAGNQLDIAHHRTVYDAILQKHHW
jgi:hypothetical protein